MPKKVAIGVVTGDKMSKTRRVEIARQVQVPRQGVTLAREADGVSARGE